MNSTQSEQLFERSKKVSPGGVHSPVRAFKGVGGVPPFMTQAKGARIQDVDGNHYIDFCQSWGPMILGHADEEVLSAAQEALLKGSSFGTAEVGSLELAELMSSEIPWAQKVRFVNSGTEAVMSALRVARAATGRSKVLKFNGCYHGHVDSMLVKAGSGLADMPSPDSAGVSKQVAAETLVAPLNDLDAVKTLFEQKGTDIAAIIVEPLPANNGLLPQTKDFLQGLREITRKNGSLLIFDEVISGFRVAFGGMAEKLGIEPDLVTYGKVIGGGFPVGAYAGKREYMDLVAPLGPVYQAGTLSANPVAMAAGLATLKKLKRDQPYSKLEKLNAKLKSGLESISTPTPFQLQTFGSLFWGLFGKVESKDGIVRSPDQIPAPHGEIYKDLFHPLLDKGVYLAPSAFEVGFLSTAHTLADIEDTVSAVQDIFDKGSSNRSVLE